jgi:hypothetical protein
MVYSKQGCEINRMSTYLLQPIFAAYFCHFVSARSIFKISRIQNLLAKLKDANPSRIPGWYAYTIDSGRELHRPNELFKIRDKEQAINFYRRGIRANEANIPFKELIENRSYHALADYLSFLLRNGM